MFTDRRRAHVRVRPKAGEPVEAQIIGGDFMDEFRVLDISEGGVGLFVQHGFAGCNLDAQIDVLLKLPRERAFMTRGVIRHRSHDGLTFGVQFTNLGDEERKRIARYVKRRTDEGAPSP